MIFDLPIFTTLDPPRIHHGSRWRRQRGDSELWAAPQRGGRAAQPRALPALAHALHVAAAHAEAVGSGAVVMDGSRSWFMRLMYVDALGMKQDVLQDVWQKLEEYDERVEFVRCL